MTIQLTSVAQPPGKHWEAVAFNQTTNELAVFGGAEFQGSKIFVTDSLWLHNDKWRVIDGGDVQGRWAHSMVYHNNILYMYGGIRLDSEGKEVILNSLYRYDDGWVKIADGPKLSLPTLVSADGNLLLAGQPLDNKNTYEIWKFFQESFQKKLTTKLEKKDEELRALSVGHDLVVIYASDTGLTFHNVNNGKITLIKDISRRTKFGITYNPLLTTYYLFGGLDHERNPLNELWEIRNNRAKKLTGQEFPSPRSSCSLLPADGGFIMYGGSETGGTLSNELWTYKPNQWIQIKD